MKYFVALAFSTIWFQSAAADLLGTWKYTEFTYEGETQPAPNPNLDLRFTFTPDGVSLLRWFRSDEDGFCERKADYEIQEEKTLRQKITWVNPANDANCSSDTDMQMDAESFTKFRIENNKLIFELELSEKPFLYILTRIEPSASL